MGNTDRFSVLALGAILCVLYFALPATGQLEVESRQENLTRSERQSSDPTTASSWFDTFTDLNSRWEFAGGWTNGGIFNAGWDAGYYLLKYSALYLYVRKETWVDPNNPSAVLPSTGGEIRTKNVEYGYGCYSACMRPTSTSGIVSGFFTYAGGVWDTPTPPWPSSPVPHREIDIEFLVDNGVGKMQSNYFNSPGINDPSEGHEQLHDLPGGADAFEKFNSYAFKWHPDYIEWFQNDVSVRKVTHSDQTPIPQESTSVGRLVANVFAVNSLGSNWAGTVPSDFDNDRFSIKWIEYTQGTECSVVPKCSSRD